MSTTPQPRHAPPTIAALAPQQLSKQSARKKKRPLPVWLLVAAAGALAVALCLCSSPELLYYSGGGVRHSHRCPRWLTHHAPPVAVGGPTGSIDAIRAREHHHRRQRLLAAALSAAERLRAPAALNTTLSTPRAEALHAILLSGRCAAQEPSDVARIDAARAALSRIRQLSARNATAAPNERAHGARSNRTLAVPKPATHAAGTLSDRLQPS